VGLFCSDARWLLPFGKDLINWTDAAVIIPEAETLDTVKFLSKISAEQRCRMRQKGVCDVREIHGNQPWCRSRGNHRKL
jgi:hypothetical protein